MIPLIAIYIYVATTLTSSSNNLELKSMAVDYKYGLRIISP